MENSQESKPYTCLLALTGSVILETESILFSTKKKHFFTVMNLDERLRKCFQEGFESRLTTFELQDLCEFKNHIGNLTAPVEQLELKNKDVEMPKEQEKRLNQPQSRYEYRLPYEKTDKILNFHDISNEADFDKFWETETYSKMLSGSRPVKTDVLDRLFSRNRAQKQPLLNEWAIVGSTSNDENKTFVNDWKAAYNILLLMGIRRSLIFSPEMALKVFNICLPVGRIKIEEAKEEAKSETENFLIVPLITLNAKPETLHFRNALTLSLIIIPVNKDFSGPRTLSDQEMCHIERDAKFKLQHSPLLGFADKFVNIAENCTLGNLLENIYLIIRRIINANDSVEDYKGQLIISKYITKCIQTPYLEDNDIEEFHLNSISRDLRNELKKLVIPESRLRDKYLPLPDAVNFQNMVIIDDARMDSAYLMFFYLENSSLIGLTNSKRENFPCNSFKKAFAWFLYMSINMSVLDSMFHSFYKDLNHNKHQAKTLGNIESEFYEDLDEFFELDIMNKMYKQEYERMRKIAGIDKDYKMLKEKLRALKTNLVLEEQRGVNTKLIFLSAGSMIVATIAIVLTLANLHLQLPRIPFAVDLLEKLIIKLKEFSFHSRNL